MKEIILKPGRNKSSLSVLKPIACALTIALWSGSIYARAQQGEPGDQQKQSKQDKPHPGPTEMSREDLRNIEVKTV
ncbi:MAG: hypothetical protein AB1631_01380 [Acidobacteriota bacterium]